MEITKKKLVLVTIRDEAWIKRNSVRTDTGADSSYAMLAYKGFDEKHKESCVHLVGNNAHSVMWRELVGKKVYAYVDTAGVTGNPRKLYRKSTSSRSSSFFMAISDLETRCAIQSGKLSPNRDTLYRPSWAIPNWLIKGIEDVPCEVRVKVGE